MSVHVLLILLNELRKRDKIRGLSSILSRFRNEFKTFNKTESFYHRTFKLLKNRIFGVKRLAFVNF